VNESESIQRARQGDEAAWETLVRDHQEAVFRLAFLLNGNADDAQDVAQETFIRAFRALDHFDPDRSLKPWLLQIATNLSRNRRRSWRRYLQAVQRIGRLAPSSAEPDHNIQRWEAQTLWQAIRRLRPMDQEIIYLRYFLELSEEETSATLHIAPGTVKSRLHRALNRLRIVVEQEYPALREEQEA
jgi:RNA polymerase sigma-70 factor (ECF subfamily)